MSQQSETANYCRYCNGYGVKTQKIAPDTMATTNCHYCDGTGKEKPVANTATRQD